MGRRDPRVPIVALASMDLQSLEERDQVGLLTVGEADRESGVVEVHDLSKVGGHAVVEVGLTRSEAAEHGPLKLADVLPLPGQERRPGSLVLRVSPVIRFRSVYRGKSAGRNCSSVSPMSIGNATE